MTKGTPKTATTTTSAGGAATVAAVPSSPPVEDLSLPCPYRQAALLQQALSPDKMRVGFFLGAGCPLAVEIPAGTGTWPLIPNIEGLTDKIRVTVGASGTHGVHFNKILQQLGDTATTRKTVEHVLTRIRGLLEVVGTGVFEGMNADDLGKLDKAICKDIDSVMRKRLPTQSTPYHQLAEWIRSIPRAHPVEIFTSNYDLLMEQALEESEVPYFDGFAGSARAFFDLSSMEHENLPSRWARLWKVHGSINWWRTSNKRVHRGDMADDTDAQMIHPSHMKYEESRKMPYLAMQDRLRAFLARGQVVLVTCGYSFQDEHLNRAILDGLIGNPTAVCFGLLWGDRKEAAAAISKAGACGNLKLLAADGAVLRKVDKDWHASPKSDDVCSRTAVSVGALSPKRSSAPADRCKFLLGDFKALGDFLASQLADDARDRGDGDAA
jgi:SIR2-like domain